MYIVQSTKISAVKSHIIFHTGVSALICKKKEANFLTPYYGSGQNGSHPISADFQFACTRGEIRLSGASPFFPPCCYSAAWWRCPPPPSPPRPTSRPPPTVTGAVTSNCCCGGGARPPPRPLYQHLSENRKACVRTEELIVDNYVKIAAPQHCWIWQAIGQTKPHRWIYELALRRRILKMKAGQREFWILSLFRCDSISCNYLVICFYFFTVSSKCDEMIIKM